MKNVKTFEDFLSESLKPKNPNAVITIDVDLVGDDKDIMDAIKKFKLKAEPNGANDGMGYDLTGKRKDLIAYLTSKYHELEDEDVEDIWPELLEGILESETGIFVMDNMRRHLHVAPKDVKDYIKGKKVFATDEDGEEYEIDKKNTDVVSDMKRKSGYYWVNIHSSYGWNIGLWSSFTEKWSFFVTKNEWTDDLVIEVDENEIVRK